MESKVFIIDENVKCLHVIIQGTHKMVMTSRINFEDHALIKRWWVGKKMSAIGGKLKDKKKAR
jgi:hypothetical protein